VFVNDGSTDSTLTVLEELRSQYPQKVHVISNEKNLGKAESVRNGIRFCNENFDHSTIGYVDADLSASIEECVGLREYVKENISFVFGSRKLKKGKVEKRNWFRLIVGRIIAAIISNILRIQVNDTQCGCKLFTKEESKLLFEDPFISKWLFDVELFKRMILIYGKETAKKRMKEVPMKKWIDEGSSKMKVSYFFNMWIDLWRISQIKTTNLISNYSVTKNNKLNT
jgi:Glycosyl transferase family 2.